MPNRFCQGCTAPLPIQNGRHQPRKFCETCRPPRNRGKDERVAEIRPGVQADALSLVAATRAALLEADRLSRPESVLVLNLAKSIDDGGHSGASLASLSNAYSRALTVALADAEKADASADVTWDVG